MTFLDALLVLVASWCLIFLWALLDASRSAGRR